MWLSMEGFATHAKGQGGHSIGRKVELGPTASVSFVKERVAPKSPSYPLVPRFGSMIVPCRYDARTSLLATGMLGKESLGRPSPSLAKALKTLK